MFVLINPTLEQVVLSNLKADATNQVIMDRCRMYLDAAILGRDLRTFDMVITVVKVYFLSNICNGIGHDCYLIT